MHRHRLSHSSRTRSSRPCPSHRPPLCRSRRSGRQKLPRPSSAPHFASVQAKSECGVYPPSGLSFCRHDHCTTHTRSPFPRPAPPCLLRVSSWHHLALALVADALQPPLVVHAACTKREKNTVAAASGRMRGTHEESARWKTELRTRRVIVCREGCRGEYSLEKYWNTDMTKVKHPKEPIESLCRASPSACP